MCGIVGFLGKPIDRQLSFQLTTSLLVKTQIRGDDASGYWASDCLPDDQNGSIYFSKAPVKSTEFVQSEPWQTLKDVDINILVSHCRKSTIKGSENRNRNNHPFLSSDCRTALVHNGNIPEYHDLNKGYEHQKGYTTLSECDSEILLRIMERGHRYDNDYLRKQLGKVKSDTDKLIGDCSDEELPLWSRTLLGLVDIFTRVNWGAMAVTIGERWENGTRALWLFRNKERPLNVIDMRETLNQIYIASEKKIWREAFDDTPTVKRFVKGSIPIIDLRPESVWLLTYNENVEEKFALRKFKMNRQRRNDTTFEAERPDNLLPIVKRKSINVITDLAHGDEHVAKDNTIEKKR